MADKVKKMEVGIGGTLPELGLMGGTALYTLMPGNLWQLRLPKKKELKDFANLIIQKHEAICALEATDDTMCIDFGLRIGTRLPNNTRGPPPNWLVPKLLDGLSVDATQAADALAKETAKSHSFNYGNYLFNFTTSKEKKNEEKTPIHQIIRRIDMMCLLCRCCYVGVVMMFGTHSVFLCIYHVSFFHY
ncbi:rifin PIR protein,putative [Plasmodium sp. DRC-Itaito]|nr:rifin PIR protein,putative [Plasmodium sp. DRC-Itaito]